VMVGSRFSVRGVGEAAGKLRRWTSALG